MSYEGLGPIDQLTARVIVAIDIAASLGRSSPPIDWQTLRCALCKAAIPRSDTGDLLTPGGLDWHEERCDWRRAQELWG